MILGATDHPGFGSFVLAGPGGVLAEISAQASVRLGSVDLTTARAMLQEARRRQATGRRVGHAATSMLRLGRPSLSRTTRRSSPCRASICCSNRTDAQTRSGAKWGRVEGGCKRSRLLLASPHCWERGGICAIAMLWLHPSRRLRAVVLCLYNQAGRHAVRRSLITEPTTVSPARRPGQRADRLLRNARLRNWCGLALATNLLQICTSRGTSR